MWTSATPFQSTYWMLVILWMEALTTTSSSHPFDPYMQNGGLVAAVAGRDYVVLATDTRMTGESGYDLLHRHYTSSRLWPVLDQLDENEEYWDDDDLDKDKDRIDPYSSKVAEDRAPPSAPVVATAASVPSPPKQEDYLHCIHTSRRRSKRSACGGGGDADADGCSGAATASAVWMATAGCAADCDMLQRLVQAEWRAAKAFAEGGATGMIMNGSALQVAHAVSQTLYQRRSFPFYSFCVVGGLDVAVAASAPLDIQESTSDDVGGAVFVYDAIGSYERVAVACAGTGRELLQPILDRLFQQKPPAENTIRETPSDVTQTALGKMGQDPSQLMSRTTGSTRSLIQQRTWHVDCSVHDALHKLIQAYRAVSEREIGVGDAVIFCVLQQQHQPRTTSRRLHTNDVALERRLYMTPLKKH